VINCSLPFYVVPVLLVGGCSLNGIGIPGTVNETTTNLAAGRSVSVLAVGFNVYTKGGFGMHLGQIERTLYYPALADDPVQCVVMDTGAPARVSAPRPAIARTPLVWNHSHTGLGIDFTGGAVRFVLGVGRRHEIRAKQHDHFLLYYLETGMTAEARLCAQHHEPRGPH